MVSQTTKFTLGGLLAVIVAFCSYTEITTPRHHGPFYGSVRRVNTDPQNYFLNQDQLLIWKQSWRTKQTPKGLIFLVHGYGEHCGRYNHVATHFTDLAYDVWCMDHQGFGRSEGERAFVQQFQDWINDYLQFVNLTRTENYKNKQDLPQYLLGHSLGGLIASSVAIQSPSLWKAVVLSSPFLAKDPEHVSDLEVKLLTPLARLFPKIRLDSKLNPEFVSRDPAVVKAYIDDPLVYKGPITLREGAEMFSRLTAFAHEQSGFELPLYVAVGSQDRLANPEGGKAFVHNAKSKDKTLKVWEGLFHEIMNEPEKAQVLEDMSAWISKH